MSTWQPSVRLGVNTERCLSKSRCPHHDLSHGPHTFSKTRVHLELGPQADKDTRQHLLCFWLRQPHAVVLVAARDRQHHCPRRLRRPALLSCQHLPTPELHGWGLRTVSPGRAQWSVRPCRKARGDPGVADGENSQAVVAIGPLEVQPPSSLPS